MRHKRPSQRLSEANVERWRSQHGNEINDAFDTINAIAAFQDLLP
mgnify:CR=1 FL=1